MADETKELKDEELEQVAGAGLYTDMSRFKVLASGENVGDPVICQTNQFQLMMQKKKEEDYMTSALISSK